MVEMENTKLDHDQEVLRLKGLLAQKAPTSKYSPPLLSNKSSLSIISEGKH